MAKYVVLRTDSERNIVVINKTNNLLEAQTALKEDFKYWFYEKYEKKENISFEEDYENHEADEYDLNETIAWLNNCNHTDFDWKIVNTTIDGILNTPFSMKEMILKTTNDYPYLTGYVEFDFGNILDCNIEDFFDFLSEQLTGSPCLSDISYDLIDTNGNCIVLSVSGDVSYVLSMEEELIEELVEKLLTFKKEEIELFIDRTLDKIVYENKKELKNILFAFVEEMEENDFFDAYRKYMKE